MSCVHEMKKYGCSRPKPRICFTMTLLHRRHESILPLDFLAACSGISWVIQCDGVSLKKELYWVIYSPPQRPGQDYSVF